MQTRSSSKFVSESSTNPPSTSTNTKRRNCIRSKQRVELFALEEIPVVMMADQRTMAELLRAPTKGYTEAIIVPPIPVEHFELKHSLINLVTSKQFFGFKKEDPHAHIRYFNKITSTLKYKDVPETSIKLMLFPFSIDVPAQIWLDKEHPRSILTWDDLVSKFINEFFPPSRMTYLRNEISNFQQKFDESFYEAWDRYKDLLRACPHHGFTELHRLDTLYNALNPADQDSLNSAAGGNLLERTKLTHAVNQQMSVVTTAMTAILKQFQATPPPASVKAVEEIYVTCGGAHPYYQCLSADGNTFPEYQDNIQGYVAATAVNYNQGNSGYRPPGMANQTRPPGFAQQNMQNNQNWFSQPQGYNRGNNFNQNTTYQAPIQQNQSVPLSELEKIKKINDVNIKSMQAQINNVKNELRNEMQNSIQTSMSNQTNELKNMMASFFQMNTASTSSSGSLPSNTIANPKGELKAITTRSGLVLDGPTVPMPPPFINPKEDERVEETLTDPEHGEFTIKDPHPLVQKAKPPSQRNYVVHQRDTRHPHIPYPSRMNQEKQKGKDEVQIHKFWQMFKQLHINITLVDAFILILKYQKMLKSLISNKEKLLELANTPLNENCSAVILKKLPEKLEILVSLILGRPFLRTAHALIDVHGEEMILHDEVNDDIFDPEGDIIENLLNLDKTKDLPPYHDNQLSGNPTLISKPVTKSSASSPTLTSIEESELIWEEFEAYLASDLFPPVNSNHLSPLPPFHNSLSGSTTSSSLSLPISETSDYFLEEFADGLALITFLPGNDDILIDIESDLREIKYLLNHDPIKEMDSILEDSVDFPNNDLVDNISEMFTNEHALDYSAPPLSDDYDDELFDLETFSIRIFSEVDALSSTNNEDKVFNPGILIYENLFEVTNCATPKKNVKKTTNASLILKDFNPPLYELPLQKEVPGSKTLLSFSSENEEKVFNPGILTSKGVHTYLLPELSHRGTKAFNIIKNFESPIEIFPCSYGEDICVLDVPCLHFYPP
ncbi:reverse transcriptase domain-containing protein [Tanacetum coccineum]|uniref:Reverse transcriptase domain-containing protein n=1 Tax=Tanacetum coccineum TaxID=301880 RepID=A0ABQ5H8Z0_9ASTR